MSRKSGRTIDITVRIPTQRQSQGIVIAKSTYFVRAVLGIERVAREGIFISLDNLEAINRLGKHPQIAFLMANATIASIHNLDFRQLNLIHKSLAVAVATIRAKGLLALRGSHFQKLSHQKKTKLELIR